MKCYSSHHLSFAETAVLGVCLRLTCGGSKPLHFDGRSVAARFTGESHQKVYRTVKGLEAKGWLIRRLGGHRVHAKNGLYAHIVYDVLDHEQWAMKHKGGCRTVITGDYGDTNRPSSQVRHAPSSPVRHSSVIELPSYPLKPESSHKVLQVRQETSKDVHTTVITGDYGSTDIDYARIFKEKCEKGEIG
jgi:hypothetical protein